MALSKCRGALHCHTDNSVRDSAMKPKDLVQHARELGAAAVAITDHGVMAGVYEFMKACEGKKAPDGSYIVPPIKGIPGVEAYFIPDRNSEDINVKRQHLLLLSRDEQGFQAIYKAVTESNMLMKKSGYPLMDYALLEKHFGPGSPGHKHVVATSACMAGVLAQLLLADEDTKRAMGRIRRNQEKYHPMNDAYLDMRKEKEDMESEITGLRNERDVLASLAKGGLKKVQQVIDAGQGRLNNHLWKLLQDKSLPDIRTVAQAELTTLKDRLAEKQKALTMFNTRFKHVHEQVEKWLSYEEQVQQVLAGTRSDAERYNDAVKTATSFSEVFGEGHFFVEVQYHGIEQEARCMPQLVQISRKLGLPLVATNDAHYARKEDAHARELVAAMRFRKLITENKEPGYDQLYLKTDEELEASLSEILDQDAVEEAMGNISLIVDMCNVTIKKGVHYPKYIGTYPEKNTRELLHRLAKEGITWRYPNPGDWTEEHQKRMEHELAVINRTGYNDYLCIVHDFLNYGRKIALDNPDGVGYGVGPGRGSAVGSLVCYLTGITSIDPMKYGLLFERFLNEERVSQPDIDSDFHTEFRSVVLEYVQQKYGKNAVASIITKGTMMARGALRNVGAVTGVPAYIVDQVARMIPMAPNTTLRTLPAELQKKYDEDPIVRQLIDDARQVEGAANSFGTHAAGVIISDNDNIGEYVPLIYNADEDQWAVQFTMEECEELGLLKMDFLGLKNVTIIDDTLHRIFRNCGKRIDIEKVPFEDEVFEKVFAAGQTNCIFQFESPGMKEMLKKCRPSSFADLILLVAAYRPGPMQYLSSVIDVKHGKQTPTYVVPQLEPILEPTYGKPIYQEQMCETF